MVRTDGEVAMTVAVEARCRIMDDHRVPLLSGEVTDRRLECRDWRTVLEWARDRGLTTGSRGERMDPGLLAGLQEAVRRGVGPDGPPRGGLRSGDGRFGAGVTS
jgi:hypothetical protein